MTASRSAVRTQILQLSLRTLSGVRGFFWGMGKIRDEIFSFLSLKIRILAVIGQRKAKTSMSVCIP